ncbi:HWE histidine kinase domain-containing protein [Sphingomonas carotinifaciens]|uniref:HWE histidine kinase domain-containing protein n=1 Tax=Sphingomonas carotinifaciens TaxID=1166323 RepID=UPI0039A14763
MATIAHIRPVETVLGPFSAWPPELQSAAGMVLTMGVPAALVWGAGLVTIHNAAFAQLIGLDANGQAFDAIWAGHWPGCAAVVERVRRGETAKGDDRPIALHRDDPDEVASCSYACSPVRDAKGQVAGFIDILIETSEAMRARAEMVMLNRELGHRLKNTMAMVGAIASQSLKGVVEREAVEIFQARIVALGHAHDVLLQENWAAAPIETVVDTALRLHDDSERFAVTGAPVQLGSRAVLSLSLLLHELATNAVKHGALSVAGGHVDLSWRVDGEDLCLDWIERDGPAVVAPARGGFGSRLIGMGLVGTGHVERHFHPTGFAAHFRAPLVQVQQT